MALPPEPVGLAATVRMLRLRGGLSQRQLAGRMGVPRTYVSKIENGKATPMLSSLEKLARGLGVSIGELLDAREQQRSAAIRELMGDPFITELLPFLPRLSQLQMDGALIEVRQMAQRPRRSA
jgi:transcriptional regulator with XRE-family HTH domain